MKKKEIKRLISDTYISKYPYIMNPYCASKEQVAIGSFISELFHKIDDYRKDKNV